VRWRLAAAAALFTITLTTFVWGGWRAPATVDDEAAYLLQADLFAHGHWSRPGPVPPESFTQSAVLVTPVLAPKMAPGHALVLAPGLAIGLPGLVSVLLSGATAALLVLLACEVQSAAVAVLTVILWLAAAGQMRWRASYFSEITTGMLWLLGWWALLRWRATRRPGWLMLLAAATGLGAITRPLTMLAFAMPVGVVVLIDVVRGKHWSQLAGAMALGIACLAVLPIQNEEVLGNWRSSPLALYTRQYMPFDVIGFGYDSTPPSIGLPADLQHVQLSFIARHREHVPAQLPHILYLRVRQLALSVFGTWRMLWIPAAIVGALLIGAAGWFAVGTGLLLYLAYLLYAHEPYWTVYYLEASPVAAFVCATGLAWLLARASGAARELPLGTAGLTVVAIVAIAQVDWRNSRAFRAGDQAPSRKLEQAVRAAGNSHALVFVCHSPGNDPDANHLVRNVADIATAPIVTAHDRGPVENARVAAAFPDRTPVRWDGTLGAIVAPGSDSCR
jgi:hypothetical protein